MEYIHDVHTSQYELQQNFNQRHNPNGIFNESMGSTRIRTRSWIQEQQHQTQQTQQQPSQPSGMQMNQALYYSQQHLHQQAHQQQQQPQQHHQHQQPHQHELVNQQSNHLSASFNQQSNSSWFNQQQHQQTQQQQQYQPQQQPQQQLPQHQQLYQHQSTLQWTQLDSFNLNRIIDQSIVNHDLLINSFQSQLINQQPHQQQIYQHQQPQHPQPHQYQQPLLYPNRQRHDLLYYKQLQEQESQQIYNQNDQQNHQKPQQPQQQPQQPKPLPKKVLFKFILNLTKQEAEQYLVQIAQTPALSTRIRLVENERKNLTVNLIETLHPTNKFQQQPEEYVFVSIELIIVKSAEAKKADEAQKEDCLHVEEIEDEVEVENKNTEDRVRKVVEIQEDCVRVEEIGGKVEDKQTKLTRPSILIFSSSKNKEQVNVETNLEMNDKTNVETNAESHLETNVETNVETIDETQNVEHTAPDSQTLQTFSDQDVELNDQSTTTTVSIELDETIDEVKDNENLKVINPERPLSLSFPEALTIQNILPDSSSSLLCTEDMPISPFLDQIKIPLGMIDPVGSTLDSSVQSDKIIDSSQVESSGTETNCNDSDATEIDNETVNETSVSESNIKRTQTSTTSSTVSISVSKRTKIKVDSSKSPNLQSTTYSSTKTPKLQTKRKSSPKANPQRSKKHYHQSHLDLSSIIQPRVSTTKRLTRSSIASLVQQKQQQQPKRGTRKGPSSKSNKLKRN